jgi:hypothetical protein
MALPIRAILVICAAIITHLIVFIHKTIKRKNRACTYLWEGAMVNDLIPRERV